MMFGCTTDSRAATTTAATWTSPRISSARDGHRERSSPSASRRRRVRARFRVGMRVGGRSHNNIRTSGCRSLGVRPPYRAGWRTEHGSTSWRRWGGGLDLNLCLIRDHLAVHIRERRRRYVPRARSRHGRHRLRTRLCTCVSGHRKRTTSWGLVAITIGVCVVDTIYVGRRRVRVRFRRGI